MTLCEEKKRFDKKTAQTVCNYRRGRGEKDTRIYHCPHCNFWHLTHQEFIDDRWE